MEEIRRIDGAEMQLVIAVRTLRGEGSAEDPSAAYVEYYTTGGDYIGKVKLTSWEQQNHMLRAQIQLQ